LYVVDDVASPVDIAVHYAYISSVRENFEVEAGALRRAGEIWRNIAAVVDKRGFEAEAVDRIALLRREGLTAKDAQLAHLRLMRLVDTKVESYNLEFFFRRLALSYNEILRRE
jgi:hypothetical protein